MGSPEDEKGLSDEDDEGPVTVEITRPFWMLSVPMTVGLYHELDPTHQSDHDDPYWPVTELNHYEARLACRALTALFRGNWGLLVGDADADQYRDYVIRLPTEAEYELAARLRVGKDGKLGATTDRWWMSNDPKDLDEVAWYENNAGESLHRVAQKRPNGAGLFDVHGLAWMWCHDWYDRTLRSGGDPQGPDRGTARVQRAGSFLQGPRFLRAAQRFGGRPWRRDDFIFGVGFRPVLAPQLGVRPSSLES